MRCAREGRRQRLSALEVAVRREEHEQRGLSVDQRHASVEIDASLWLPEARQAQPVNGSSSSSSSAKVTARCGASALRRIKSGSMAPASRGTVGSLLAETAL
eukprot:CAMPEP_0195650832 /NCGR_PEP_ID=MMETSP0815-20121206/31926_1 /TAXON_ID=97485 /ORGANISM="Prymnesium parvum, Strain Texoma1" /LENGTH=101 /DNA_ID=CAMNT_0040794661 /DNA_START=748 /DNA_END=1050 /DNA_ORIENTATION=+